MFKTWDQHCLDKLKEIQPATQIEWTKAMGFKNTGNITAIIKKYRNLLVISRRNNGHKSKTYQIRDKEPLECDHYWRDKSNHWFHWNTGEVMCLAECVKCGLNKEILYKIIKEQKSHGD